MKTIHQLRPLSDNQTWGIFLVEIEHRLPVVSYIVRRMPPFTSRASPMNIERKPTCLKNSPPHLAA